MANRNQVILAAAKISLAIFLSSLRNTAYPEQATAIPILPFESAQWAIPENPVDRHVLAKLREKNIEPALPASDEVFIRRVYLDMTGMPPGPADVISFLDDSRPDKRALLIDSLMQREEFAEYRSLKWCDILRVKSEFPINLWPNAVQAYHRWILENLRDNTPYDEFARQMLTASGSNFRVPPVNFYRAVQGRDPSSIASAVALTFMGTRFFSLEETVRSDMTAFFSRVAYKSTAEWKEEIVYLSPEPSGNILTGLPDGKRVTIPSGIDPRSVFADWLISPDNPWFAKNMANRIWSWLIGRGIIHEPDDIRSDNPASNPELLAFLESELVRSGYDMLHLYRLILNSRTYQQSSIPRSMDPVAQELFAFYPIRRLEAEVLADILDNIRGSGDEYISPIPEPFTFIPRYRRNVLLADGSITSPFLELFGRPARDTGLESERNNTIDESQQVYLLNSGEMQRRITSSPQLRRMIRTSRGDNERLVTDIYLFVLSRHPTQEELQAAARHFHNEGLERRQGAEDIMWALINSKAFLYRH